MKIFDVAFLGTSLTAGSGTGWVNETRVPGGMWQPFVAEALVSQKTEEFRYYNFGISGGTSFDALPFIHDWAALRPRMLIMEYGMNDGATARNVSLLESKENAEAIINAFRAANPDILVGMMTMNTVSADRAPDRPILSEYYDVYRDMVDTRTDLFLVDNTPMWGEYPDPEEVVDGLHPLLSPLKVKLVPMVVAAIQPHMQ